MDNPGDYTLFSGAINSATNRTTGVKSALAVDLSGITALSLDFDFAYGAGGNTCSAIVQAVPSNGGRAFDIARADFAKVSRRVQMNLEGLLSKAPSAYADLSAEGVNDGMLFSGLQVIILTDTTGGDYSNTTLNISAAVR